MKLYRYHDLSELTGKSESALRQLVCRGTIPCHWTGRAVYFTDEDLKQMLVPGGSLSTNREKHPCQKN